MPESLHHVHIFASDMDATITWWREMLGAEVYFDGEMGGARNVFLKIGGGRLHIYEQPPRREGRNTSVHHLGIRTNDLASLAARLRNKGVAFRGEIRDFGSWSYLMCMAPDDVLLELFEIDTGRMPPALAAYFVAEPSGS